MKLPRCYLNSARLHEELLFLQAHSIFLHERFDFLHDISHSLRDILSKQKIQSLYSPLFKP